MPPSVGTPHQLYCPDEATLSGVSAVVASAEEQTKQYSVPEICYDTFSLCPFTDLV